MHITSDLERHKDKGRKIFVYAQNERCQTLVHRVWNKDGEWKERKNQVGRMAVMCMWSITNGRMRHVLLKKRNNLMSINSIPRNAVQGKEARRREVFSRSSLNRRQYLKLPQTIYILMIRYWLSWRWLESQSDIRVQKHHLNKYSHTQNEDGISRRG